METSDSSPTPAASNALSAGAGELPAGSDRALLDCLPWGVLMLTPEGTVTYLNAPAATLWGIPALAALGREPAQVQPSVLPAALLQALRQPSTPPAEYWLPYTQQWVALRSTPAPDGYRWVFWDNVTERRQAEAAQQRIRELLLAVEEVAHTGSYEADLATMAFYFSDGMYRLFGEAPQAFVPTLDFIDARSHPADAAHVRQVLDHAVRNHQPYQYLRRIYWPSGEERTLEAHGQMVCDATGTPVMLRGLVQDVTGRQRAEQQRQQSHALLQATIDSSLDLVQAFRAVRDEQGRVVDFAWVLNNAAAERRYGDILGQHLCQLNPGVVETGIFDTFKQVLETGVPDQSERHYVHEQFNCWFHQSVVKLGDGVVTTTHDITQRKQGEQEIRETKELLQAVLDNSRFVIQAFRAVRGSSGKIVDFTWLLTNQAGLEQLGGLMAGKSLLHENPGVVETGLFDLFVQVTETGVPVDHEQYYAHEQFAGWFHQTLVKLGDGFVMNTVDITARRQAEQELRTTKELLQSIFDTSPTAISTYRPVYQAEELVDFRIVLINAFAEQLSGVNSTGRLLTEAFPTVMQSGVFETLKQALVQQQKQDVELWYEGEGLHHWLRLIAVPMEGLVLLTTEVVTERKQAQEEVLRLKDEVARKATDKYELIFNSIDEGFCVLEVLYDEEDNPIDYRFVEVNPTFEHQTGLKDVTGKTFRALLTTEPQWMATYDKVVKTGEAAQFEDYYQGNGQWYQVRASRIDHSHSLAITFTDITERKRLAAKQVYLLKLSDALRPLADPVEVQSAAARVLGEHLGAGRAAYAEVEADDAHFTVHREYSDGMPSFTGRYLLNNYGPAFWADFRAGRTVVVDDAERDAQLSEAERATYAAGMVRAAVAVPLVKAERLVGVFFLHFPVPHEWAAQEVALVEETAERTWSAVERARAEEALQASHTRLVGVLERTHDAFYDLDAELRFTYVNQRAAQLWGRTVDTLLARRCWEEFSQSVGSEAYHQHQQVLQTGEPVHFETVSPVLNTWIEVSIYPSQSGGLSVFFRDITARKHAEEGLRASEARLAAVFEALPVGIGLGDAQGRLTLANQQMQYYLPTGAMPSKDDTQFMRWHAYQPDGTPLPRTEFPGARALRGEKVVPGIEMRYTPEAGAEVWTQVIAVPFRTRAGDVAGHVTVVLDIDARKRAEQALRQSEEQFRLFVTTSTDTLYRMSPDWRQMRSLEGKRFLANTDDPSATWVERYIPLEDQATTWAIIHAAIASQLPFELEHRVIQADGSVGWMYSRAVPVLSPKGDILEWFGAATDITARKRAEIALHLSEQRLSLALQAGRMGSFEWTSEGQRITLSSISEEVLGLLPGTCMATSSAFMELVYPTDRARHQELFEQAGRAGADLHSVYRVVRPLDGQVRWIEERAQGTQDPATGVVCLRGVHWDITESMLTQQRLTEFNAQLEALVAYRTHELQANRDLLQSVFDTNLVAMSVLEAIRDDAGAVQDFRLRLVNREVERQTGRTDLEGKRYAQEYLGIREAGLFDLAVRALETGEPQGMEYYYPHEGFFKWFTCQFVKLGDEGIVATNLDITERKMAEQELRKNLRLLEQAEAVAGLGSWDYDLATGVMHWSTGMYQLLGLPLGQPVSPDVYLRFVEDEDRPRADQLVHCLTTGSGSFEETLRLHVGEQTKTVHLRAVVLHDEAGRPARVLGVDLDISELQRLEADNLRLRLTQQQQLFNAVQDAQEEERKRMAESLHNGIGQILYATKLRLDRLHTPLLGTDPPLAAARREADQLLVEAIRQTRALSHELVPIVLQEFGLAAALQDIGHKMSAPQLRLRSHVVLDEAAAPILPALQMALYRMAQELAQNIVKHAHGATEASLELETMPGWVLLRAEDNGSGFVQTSTKRPGLGMRSIRDRVSLLGGQVESGSVATGGAYVRIRIPLPGTLPPDSPVSP